MFSKYLSDKVYLGSRWVRYQNGSIPPPTKIAEVENTLTFMSYILLKMHPIDTHVQ